jgi:4-carboxymuconolactone decarboxylase
MDSYYKPEHLARFGSIAEGNQKLADKFFEWYGEVFKPGALSAREKALIALAVAQVVQCPYCIDAYSRESLQQGADLEQMTEALHVAAAIRGGASLVHGVQMLEHVHKQVMA